MHVGIYSGAYDGQAGHRVDKSIESLLGKEPKTGSFFYAFVSHGRRGVGIVYG